MKTYSYENFRLFYYRFNIAMLDWHLEDAGFWFNLIKRASRKNPDFLIRLGEKHLGNLEMLVRSYEAKSPLFSPRCLEEENETGELADIRSHEIFQSEKELKKAVLENIDKLEFIWKGIPDVVTTEQPVDYGGKCDLFVRNNRNAFAVELKRGIAGHSVVGQIDKYLKSFRKDFIYDLWDNVGGVVIASGFTEYVCSELLPRQVWLVEYQVDERGDVFFKVRN